MQRRIAIIGGGFLGQTLALRLARRESHITLFESADHLGGLADAWQLGDVVWDRHYHVTLLSDARLRTLLAELGLADQLQWGQTRTGFFSGGRLHSLSNSLDFLRFGPLNLAEKARLAWTIFHASRIRDWRFLDTVPVEQWLRKHSGKRVFEKMWRPLLLSKLGEAYRETSAAFIWATINRMYAARRSGLKREMFGYVDGGYSRVLEHLGRRLREAGVEIRLGAAAKTVVRDPDSNTVLVTTAADRQEPFDHVVLTLPPPVAARLCPQLPVSEALHWRRVRMLGVVCLSLLLRKPLGGYYVTNITDDGFPFTGVIEMTALVDRRHFGGRTLAYLPKYVPSDDPLFSEDDEATFTRLFAGLVRMHPELDMGDVAAWRVSRARNVMAIPEIGYAARVPPVETSVPGISLVSSAQIVNNTLNVNATIGWAEACAEGISSRVFAGEGASKIITGSSEKPDVQAARELVARSG